MIPFEEIDARLKGIEKDRAWLSAMTDRSEGSIRSALAPNAELKHRSKKLQRALSDAINDEEERQRAANSITLPPAQDRLSIRCDMAQRELWEAAAERAGLALSRWAVRALDDAAHAALDEPRGNGTTDH
jgi:hypothetical protein